MNRLNLKIVSAAVGAALAWLAPAAAVAQPAYGKVEQPWYMQGKISGGISVGSSTAATALPAAGQVAAICNTGAVDASLAFGVDNTVTVVLATGTTLKAGSCRSYDLLPFSTLYKYVATISASSTTLTVETGIGSPSFNGSTVISGTTTANQGTPNTPANAWPVSLAPAAVTYTDRSRTLAAGGGADTLMAANASRHGCIIQNVSTGDLWFSSVTTAVQSQPSTWLPAGAYWECPINGVPATAISIIGATTGQAISAREW